VDVPAARRLLLVVPGLYPAGAEHQLIHLGAGLAARGYEVTLVSTGGITADVGPLLAAGVRVIGLGARRRIAKPLMFVRLVRLARRASLVHCTMWDATLWGRLAAILARRPAVVTEHTPGRDVQLSATSGAPRARWIALHNRVLDRFTRATVVVARWQIGLLAGEGVRREAIVHIPNGVPVAELIAAASAGAGRAGLGLSDDAPVIIHVARLVPSKNQRLTLDTAAWLAGELPGVHVLIVGSGSDREDLERHARDLGVAATFLGLRDDVPALMALSDLVVLPSLNEAMPMTLIEAMAVGAPIVASAVGDVGDMLGSTGAGIAVPPGDAVRFRSACLDVLGDASLRARLSEAGSRGAVRWDAAEMVAGYAELFGEVLAGRT
jgi:glycosyltransferase involved in cell wall biosynthesis